MSIHISKLRIKNFRGIEDLEIDLSKTTVITGTNNSGKTSFLRALQLAFANRLNVSFEDFYIKDGVRATDIVIDTLIIPVDDNNTVISDFQSDWEELFTTERIKLPDGESSIVPFRTLITFDEKNNTFIRKQYSLSKWYNSIENEKSWFLQPTLKEKSYIFDNIPFFYINAQRDILEDIKSKTSFLGKLLSQIEFEAADRQESENLIESLNEKTISKSPILAKIKTSLSELENTLDSSEDTIELTPFTKKIRDINKNISIHLENGNDSFPMEYQGMGTRSWSSLLTLKSFIDVANDKQEIYYPIVAVEEPEAHLHPNAQKHLYSQINEIIGQKIISTHSPYVAGVAEIVEVRSFYKNGDLKCGKIDANINSENIRKIKRQVINTRGEIYFSKLLILFEGETEEQALPILFKSYFGYESYEKGINFIGVGGKNNYHHFVRFANSFGMPCLVFSDAEISERNNVKLQVSNQLQDLLESDKIFFLDDGCNFESHLIKNGYSEEVKKAIIESTEYYNEQHKNIKEPEIIAETNSFDNEKLLEVMKSAKTKLAPHIATELNNSQKGLPQIVINLFAKIRTLIK